MLEEINSLVTSIKSIDVQINEMSERVKGLYDEIQVKFTESSGIKTTEIDQLYKQIDSTFNAKAKLESKVRNMKKEILETLLG